MLSWIKKETYRQWRMNSRISDSSLYDFLFTAADAAGSGTRFPRLYLYKISHNTHKHSIVSCETMKHNALKLSLFDLISCMKLLCPCRGRALAFWIQRHCLLGPSWMTTCSAPSCMSSAATGGWWQTFLPLPAPFRASTVQQLSASNASESWRSVFLFPFKHFVCLLLQFGHHAC